MVKIRVGNSLFRSGRYLNMTDCEWLATVLYCRSFKKSNCEQIDLIPWANPSRHSLQKSYREQIAPVALYQSSHERFAPVAHDKRAMGEICSFSRTNCSFALSLNEQIPNPDYSTLFRSFTVFCQQYFWVAPMLTPPPPHPTTAAPQWLECRPWSDVRKWLYCLSLRSWLVYNHPKNIPPVLSSSPPVLSSFPSALLQSSAALILFVIKFKFFNCMYITIFLAKTASIPVTSASASMRNL